MRWLLPHKESSRKGDQLVERFIMLKSRVDALPPLDPAARAAFDHGVDIDHLYYSSKIEGTNLTAKEIKNAVMDEKAT